MTVNAESAIYLVYSNKAFAVCYITIETASFDKSKYTEEQKAASRAFICSLCVDVHQHSASDNRGTRTVIALTQFDTILECQDWAKYNWANKEDQDWYVEYCEAMKKGLKDKYHYLIER